MVRALICGGRDLDASDVWNWLERFGHQDAAQALRCPAWWRIHTVIHGGARGADEGAAQWGESEHLRVLSFPANWKRHGKAAGPIRNARMLRDGKPDVVIAFPGGRGTADMVRQAEAAGVPVVRASIDPASPLSITGGA